MSGFDKKKSVEGWMTSSGKSYYLQYLNNEHLTARQAIIAKCAECCAGYHDGRNDCGMRDCPLYPFMPYGKIKQAFRRTKTKEDLGNEDGEYPNPDEE